MRRSGRSRFYGNARRDSDMGPGAHAQVMTGYVVDGENPATSDAFHGPLRPTSSDPLFADGYVNAKITYMGFHSGNIRVSIPALTWRPTARIDDGYQPGWRRSSIAPDEGPIGMVWPVGDHRRDPGGAVPADPPPEPESESRSERCAVGGAASPSRPPRHRRRRPCVRGAERRGPAEASPSPPASSADASSLRQTPSPGALTDCSGWEERLPARLSRPTPSSALARLLPVPPGTGRSRTW